MLKRLRRLSVLGLLAALIVVVPIAVVVTRQSYSSRTSESCPIAPRYPVKATRFGLSVSTRTVSFGEALAALESEYGSLPAIRVWDPGVPPKRAWKTRTRYLSAHTAVITSFRMPPAKVIAGRYDSQLLHFFRTAPSNHQVFWNYYHEPETPVLAKEFTAAQYREAFRHIARLAGSLCRKNLFPTLVLMGWTVDPASHLDWRDYYPGRTYVSVLAWDPYNGANSLPLSYLPVDQMFGPAYRASAAAGKPWGIAEVGSGLIEGDESGAMRAAWLTSLGAYTRAHKAAWVLYFDLADKVDFRLNDAPSVAAWRKLMHP